jgi:hypothetical protein
LQPTECSTDLPKEVFFPFVAPMVDALAQPPLKLFFTAVWALNITRNKNNHCFDKISEIPNVKMVDAPKYCL